MHCSTFLRAMVATVLYSSPTVIAIGGCYSATYPYEMDIYCGDIMAKENVFGSPRPEYGNGTQVLFHFEVDWYGKQHSFETCRSDFRNTISIYTDDGGAATLITDGISSHACGIDGFGQYMTANLTEGYYVAVVQGTPNVWPDHGSFRFAMRCDWYSIVPHDEAYAAALSTYRNSTNTNACTDALNALEACSMYAKDLEYQHDMQSEVYTGQLPISSICQDPLDFDPLVRVTESSNSRNETCAQAVHNILGVALYDMGSSLDVSDCELKSAYPGYSVGDVLSVWSGLPTNPCCGYKNFSQVCPLSITIQYNAPPTNPVPTSAPTFPIASTGDKIKLKGHKDQTVVIVVAVALSVVVSVAIAGFIYVKVHTTRMTSSSIRGSTPVGSI